MPKVSFLNENVTFEVESGVTVLKVAEDHGINLFRGIWQGASCKNWGGLGGWCGRCAVWVNDGSVKLSALGGAPSMAQVNACRTIVTKDLEVRSKPGFERNAETTEGWNQDPRPTKWKERLVKAKAAASGAGGAEADEEEPASTEG